MSSNLIRNEKIIYKNNPQFEEEDDDFDSFEPENDQLEQMKRKVAAIEEAKRSEDMITKLALQGTPNLANPYNNHANEDILQLNENNIESLKSAKNLNNINNSNANNSNSNINNHQHLILNSINNDVEIFLTKEQQEEVDLRSVFISNVDWSSQADELRQYFQSCGTIERVTILCNKWSGTPKGAAYIQFQSKESVENALLLDQKEFKNRRIHVTLKRTNLPAWMRGSTTRARRLVRSRGQTIGGPGLTTIPAAPTLYPTSYMNTGYGLSRGQYRGRFWSPF